MLRGFCCDLLVKVTLLFLTLTGSLCSSQDEISLPGWKSNADYVTQCMNNGQLGPLCDMTVVQKGKVTTLKIGPLSLSGQACLEFWYLSPVPPNIFRLTVYLKNSDGLQRIWSQTAQPKSGIRTWTQVYVPLNTVKPGTKVEFRAIHPMSGGEQIILNHIGIRRDSCGAQCEANAVLWSDESTRCLCSEGQLSCSHAPSAGMCTIHSHTDCSTFDGALFRFMAQCSYMLAKTCSATEDLPQFSVEVVNGKNNNSSLPSVNQVNVNINDFRMSLLKRQTRRVVVNGVWRTLPLTLANGTVTVNSNPAAVVLKSSFGLFVSFDYTGALHITLPSSYSDKVCGLCGNFNHDKRDDLQKPDGTDAQSATDLVENWLTGENVSACEAILVPHYCDLLEEAEYASEAYCGALVSHTGPFAACQEVLGAESYFRGCVYGMCASHGDPAVLCDTLQVYADTCKKAGVNMPLWRNSTFCSLQCGENSHYNSCAEGCPEVCSPPDQVTPCGSCEERCECDPGFKLSGGKCVQEEDCGCWYKGQHYEKGATFMEGECVQQCQCIGLNNIQCRSTQCTASEVCSVQDEVKGCFPFRPATCSVYGDPHYITFDGFAYNFHGGCSYILTTTCGSQSSVEFTVIGHNMHPPHNNFTRSKLQAVTLVVGDLRLTLNQSGHVYEQNSHVLLPYFTSGTYGQVRAYMDSGYTVVDTNFGLRMMIDGQNRLFLQVNEHYKYELCGLCGTYSDRQDDELVMPGGENATTTFQFGDSWRIQDSNKQCVSHPNNPRECNSDELKQAYNECYALLGEAFSLCHEVIHPEIYITSCVHDYCATNGDHYTLCETLKSYATACDVAGVELGQWQSGTVCDIPTSTTTAETTSTASPTPDQTLCPLNCDFENNLCGWVQLVQDSFDWTRHSGSTPSSQTGPSQDHTSGAGYYMYIEGNSVTHGDSARMLSSLCQYKGPMCLHFWYHMYGSATAMALNIYMLQDNRPTKIWSKQNNQGPVWRLGQVDITASGPFQVILEGIQGSTTKSDVAIDDISIHFGSCSGSFPGLAGGTKPPLTTDIIPTQQVCNLGCSFDQSLCNWNQMVTDAFDWTWHSGSTPTLMTGPSADHTGGGHYLYIEASGVTYGNTARLISSECSNSGPHCLQFWYHMYGSAYTMGLHVYVVEGSSARLVWRQRNDQGNMWHLAQVDLTTAGAFQIIFEGRRGSNDQSDVAIDDVSLHYGPCSGWTTERQILPATDKEQTAETEGPRPPTTGLPATTALEHTTKAELVQVCNLGCSFDQSLCNWNQMVTDAFDWTWHSGSTPTLMTGPSADHTGGGHYLYIEASSVTYGDTARLISSECSNSGPHCLQFWYHMYGSAYTMGLHVYVVEGSNARLVWRQRNDQGNMWHLAQVDLTTAGAFQIIFEGRRGSNDQSDVAIDDVSLHYGPCSGSDSSDSKVTGYPEPQTTVEPATTEMDWTTERQILPATDKEQTAETEGPRPPTTGLPATTALEHTTKAELVQVCNLGCSFDQSLCNWNQMVTDAFDWTWHSGSTPTLMTGPSADHTGGGHYLYIEASSVTYGNTARLISSECSNSGPHCLQFWYHMYGSADTMGLHVYVVEGSNARSVWRQRNDQGNMWHLAQVDLTTAGAFQIIFEGRRGSNDQSDVAIDDVSLHYGPCSGWTIARQILPATDKEQTAETEGPRPPTTGLPATTALEHTTKAELVQVCNLGCSFDQSLCNWNQMVTDAFDWTWHSGSTPTLMTGPSADHTGGGHYLYIEASSVTYGDTARLISSECSNSGPHCLQFWYHMYGSAYTMGLHVYVVEGSNARLVWRQRNDQGNMWHLAQVDLTTAGAFQIIFEGRRGSNDQSDVAIDDVSLHYGPCSGWTTERQILPATDKEQTAETEGPRPPTTGLPATTALEHTTKAELVQVCNLGCSFDQSLCNWNQMVTDAFDWTWHSGSTPTLMTGPSADHTGGGHYLYIEASSVTYGDTARLISPECSNSGPHCLQFWYHMYGSADTMGLHIYVVEGSNARLVWRQRNDQGNMWHLAQVDLTTAGAFQIIFEGRRGSNDQSDVAIDDVSLHYGPCSGWTTARQILPATDKEQTAETEGPRPPTTGLPATTALEHTTKAELVQVCNLGCSFDQSLCNWNQMVTDAFDWTWHSGSTPTLMTGPSADHTGGGHYLYIEASSVTYGDTARLISSECSNSGPHCLQFWYHMYGSADTMGLHIYVVEGSNARLVWRQRNDQGNMWHLAQVDLTTAGAFQIIFEGRRGSNDQSDVAIDDVSLHYGPCSEMGWTTARQILPATDKEQTAETERPRPPTTGLPATTALEHTTKAELVQVCNLGCSFDQSLCNWNQMVTDAFDWTWHSGSTPTLMTGPSADHTGGGHYLYIEASSVTYGDTARLISSECSNSGPHCLQFWYHMYGSADTMGLHVYVVEGSNARLVWRQRNDRGNMWHLAQVDLTTAGAFQIIFEGRRGSNDQSDVAIDDVSLHYRPCSGLNRPLTSTPVTATRPTATPQPTTIDHTNLTPSAGTTTPKEPHTTVGPQPTTVSAPTTTVADQSTTIPMQTTTANIEQATTEGPQQTTADNLKTTLGQTTTNQDQTKTPITSLQPTTETRPQPTEDKPAVCNLNCSFDQSLCNWNQMVTDAFDWTWHSGSTPTLVTGPSADHTGGGHYLYIEASSVTYGDTARLISSECSKSGPHCLQFWYHMYGSAYTMGLHIYVVEGSNARSVWRQRNDQGNMWHLAQVDLTTAGAFQIIFEGRRGSNDQSDVAIDDVSLHYGACSGLNRPVTVAPTTTPQVPTTSKPQATTTTPEPSGTAAPPHPPTAAPTLPTTTTTHTTVGSQPTTTTTSTTTTAAPLPPETPSPTPSCPANSHYTTCVSACTPTCAHLFGPPGCSNNDCVAGCVCDDGYVLKQRVCVPIQQCGCMDSSGNKYEFGDVWYTTHCSKKCKCEKHRGVGRIECEQKDECDGNSVCLQNNNGDYSCEKTGFSDCTINGDPEYRSFDNMKHDFEGEHSYVLVQTNNLPNNLQDIYIEGINGHNENDDDSSEENHSRQARDDDDEVDSDESSEEHKEYALRALKIRVYNHTMVFKPHRRLVVDGSRADTPLSPSPGLKIQEHSSRIYVKTDFGLSVEFDGHSKAEIILPHVYKRKVRGLCGNFDGNKRNDLMKPDGTQATSVQEFGESWRV